MEIKKGKWVLDIETLIDFFCCCCINYDTGEVKVFEISNRKNDFKELKFFLENNILCVITFNGNHFDNIVLNWLRQQNYEYGRPIEIISTIYKVAQSIIDSQDGFGSDYSKYKYNLPYISIDLFLYWAKMLRISKKLSLKYFAVNLDLSVVEMPIPHYRGGLTHEEMDMVVEYCKNDIEVTKALADKLKDEINLRVNIAKETGLDCISFDAPKIASELLLLEYCKSTLNSNRCNILMGGIEYYNEQDKLNKYIKLIRNTQHSKPSIIYFKNIVPIVEFKTDFFKKVYLDIRCSVNTFSKDYSYKNPDGSTLILAYGKGGLHSVNRNQSYKSTASKKVITIDVASLYPTLYINNGYFHRDYKEKLTEITTKIRKDRFEAKKAGNKIKDKTLKLILNGISGLLDNEYSWLYAPEQILALRLHGQLILSRLIEELGLNNISVISANTDGVELLLDDNKRDIFNNIVKQIEEEFNIIFEEEEYDFINYLTVNDYIAKTKKGKIKQKGEFVYKDERYEGKVLDGGNEFLIIPIALEKYFVNGIPVEETIKNHTNIYDFCAAKKVAKTYSLSFLGKKVQQLNRYFISDKRNGGYLYKQKEGKSTLENVLKATPICILNEKTDKVAQEFPIDYSFYINKCNKVIEVFEPKQLSLF